MCVYNTIEAIDCRNKYLLTNNKYRLVIVTTSFSDECRFVALVWSQVSLQVKMSDHWQDVYSDMTNPSTRGYANNVEQKVLNKVICNIIHLNDLCKRNHIYIISVCWFQHANFNFL